MSNFQTFITAATITLAVFTAAPAIAGNMAQNVAPETMTPTPSNTSSDDDAFDVETLDVRPPRGHGHNLSANSFEGPIRRVNPAALLFASFDTNMDYHINVQEFAAGVDTAFAQADKNNNAVLSLFELQDWRQSALGSDDAQPANAFFDTDYNHRVTRLEFKDALDISFKKSDKNKDGGLNFSELVTIEAAPAIRLSRPAERKP